MNFKLNSSNYLVSLKLFHMTIATKDRRPHKIGWKSQTGSSCSHWDHWHIKTESNEYQWPLVNANQTSAEWIIHSCGRHIERGSATKKWLSAVCMEKWEKWRHKRDPRSIDCCHKYYKPTIALERASTIIIDVIAVYLLKCETLMSYARGISSDKCFRFLEFIFETSSRRAVKNFTNKLQLPAELTRLWRHRTYLLSS